MDAGSRVEGLLADRPDLEPAVEAALAAEEESGGTAWTFDDIETDSGSFGELVGRGIVEDSGNGYRLADPAAVRAALSDEEPTPRSTSRDVRTLDVTFPSVDRRVVLAVLGVIGFLVAIRLVSWTSVFPGEHVVLSGNDPYFYRYWVEESLTGSGGRAGPIAAGVSTGEPLLVAVLATTAGLLGGVAAVGWLMAVYPVVAAAAVAVMSYLLAHRVSRDRRVALAAVALLAVAPAHALRTSLGFADHHAFDYVFFLLTATALVWLTTRSEDDAPRSVWLAALGLGVGVAGQVLAWNAGPLLLGATVLAILVQVPIDVRAGHSPAAARLPIVAGLGLGAALALAVHAAWAWQSALVAAGPAIVFVGAIGAVALGELTHRYDRSIRELAAVEVGVGLLGMIVLWQVRPTYWAELLGGIGRITRTGSAIAEMQPLFSAATVGSLTVLGFLLVVAVPAMTWVSVHVWRGTEGANRWAVVTAFGWFLLAISLFQVRFVGEFSPFVAVFAGLSFVWLAATVDVANRPTPFGDRREWVPSRPSGRTAGAILALFVLVAGMAAVQAPIKISQITVEEATYRTGVELGSYADEMGLTAPAERYVFSDWGRNRVYNFFAGGTYRSYGFAQDNYIDFATAQDAASWYDRLADRGAFVVTSDRLETEPSAIHHRLHENLGSATGSTEGVGHYRAIYTYDARSRVAFSLVPGARLTGNGTANVRVRARTDVDLPSETFTYERRATTDEGGSFALRVAHPGTYAVRIGDESRQVTVPESAVLDGATVPLPDR